MTLKSESIHTQKEFPQIKSLYVVNIVLKDRLIQVNLLAVKIFKTYCVIIRYINIIIYIDINFQ